MRPTTFTIEREVTTSSPPCLPAGRAGTLTTPHGTIETPAFVAVATKANVKGVAPARYSALNIQIVIANTYHLYLSPGENLVAKAGGIHKFMGFEGPVMTDSGGFQVFSLGVGFGKKVSKFLPRAKQTQHKGGKAWPSGLERRPNAVSASEEKTSARSAPQASGHDGNALGADLAPAFWDEDLATSHGKLAIVDEEGVSFTSHLNGSLHRFTPERSVEIQHKLGADIIFAFDECTAPTAQYEYQKEAMERTHRWAKRSLSAHRQNVEKNNTQGIYGIVQGGRFEDLRIESAQTIAKMDFDGFGIGGSFSKEDILGVLDKVNLVLPKEKPRHLLGIAEPEDLFIGVAAGCDTFDCVLPTRNGRTGGIYTSRGKIQIPNAEFKEDFTPLDPMCECPVCKTHTRAFVHHLFRSREMLGALLASEHNLYFLATLTKKIRESILDNRFERFHDTFLADYKP